MKKGYYIYGYNIFNESSTVLTNEDVLRYILAYQSGRKEAGEILVGYSLPMIQNIASQWLEKGNYDLDDLVQEGAIALLEYILKFEPSTIPFGASAFTAVRLAIRNYCHELKQQQVWDDKYTVTTDFRFRDIQKLLLDKTGDVQLEYEEREMKTIIWQIVEQLPDMDRTLLKLWIGADGKPYTLREIGKMFDVSRTFVNRRLLDVLQILRSKLKEMGFSEVEPSEIKTNKQKTKLASLKQL